MNKNLLFIAAVLLAAQLQAQNSWTRKADVPVSSRTYTVGFSIGSKGYFGTGGASNSGQDEKRDFWEYDPATNVWMQKADFAGGDRVRASGFSINGKGYIGLGRNYMDEYNDFWEYDPTNNEWNKKADFKGHARADAVSFNIGDKGYIGTGRSYNSIEGFKVYNDFWEYNPTTDVWTRKKDVGTVGRISAVGFGIGTKGYLGTGISSTTVTPLNDFFEYDPATDDWTPVSDFAGGATYQAVGFSIGDKGYVSNGDSFWEYNSATNTWNRQIDFGGGQRFNPVGFSVGNKGYLGLGWNYSGQVYFTDFWEFGPCNAPGDPSVFGDNQWNVYAWNDGDGTLTANPWQNNYMGYYTDTSFSFNTRSKWSYDRSPSDANTFQGCYVGADNHSWSAKRQGFICGYYGISIPRHDDAVQLFIDGAKVWEHDGCCDAHDPVWQGYLNADSKIEFRGTDGSGNSSGVITISQVKPAITLSGLNVLCPGSSVILTAGDANDYLWSTGEHTQSITVSQSGTYTVKETDNCGNLIESDPVAITELVTPGINPSGNVIANACYGDARLVVANLTLFQYYNYSYRWYKVGVADPISTNSGVNVNTEGDYYVTASYNGCTTAPSDTVHVTIPIIVDPAVFGDNQWNVYYWHDGNEADEWNPYEASYTYKGYYTEPLLSFDTRSRWDSSGAPFNANNFIGCFYYYETDYFQLSAKRVGFPCGHYKINIPGHDDWTELWVNGVKVWEHAGCCDSHLNVWEGDLGTNSTVEYKIREFTGNAYGAIGFELVNAAIVSNPAITPSGPVNICSGDIITLTSSAATGNTWSTGETTQSITVNTAGNYSVTVTGSEGCTAQSDTVNVTALPSQTWYLDADGDGYGNPNVSTQACSVLAGYVSNNTDCDDTHASAHPGAAEICDGLDNNCNGQVDEGFTKITYYRDADGDGYGDPLVFVKSCSVPAGYIANKRDCNDANAAIHPGATEICDGIDNDCDGLVDEGFTKVTYYRDADDDGYGDPTTLIRSCSVPVGYVLNKKDCNDAIAAIHPGALEIFDGIDNNCNGLIDENCAALTISDVSIVEGNKNQKTMNFVVKLSKKSTQTITVDYATQDISAAAGSDYIAKSSTLTFLPGIVKQNVAISIIGDKSVEPNETFNVVLSNAVNAPISKTAGTGTIVNDDGVVAIVSAVSAQNITEIRSVKIAPNPVKSLLNIELSGYSGNVTLQLLSLQGRVLKQEKVQPLKNYARQQMLVTGIANGTYLLIVMDEKGNRQTEKVIIER